MESMPCELFTYQCPAIPTEVCHRQGGWRLAHSDEGELGSYGQLLDVESPRTNPTVTQKDGMK